MNIDKIIEELINLKIPSEVIVKQICNKAKDILIEESNLQAVKAPVTVCGDIHGQFYDLQKIFNEGSRLSI